ncbi:unnamed protein product [Gongylonema pulchrum]|uniref:G-patch domain-containing protein n=1 Tax=Gongylonema pulchrum TaxID=637853 RepID=A0A183DPH3_9BILA|nr:unnamed protein product [Gongylonema pulchrum]
MGWSRGKDGKQQMNEADNGIVPMHDQMNTGDAPSEIESPAARALRGLGKRKNEANREVVSCIYGTTTNINDTQLFDIQVYTYYICVHI